MENTTNEAASSGQDQSPVSRSDPANRTKSSAELRSEATADMQNANVLTPEEQMALFEKQLKEDDWGHQPC